MGKLQSAGITKARDLINIYIVPPVSSLDHLNQQARTIDDDHMGMIKFQDQYDRAYDGKGGAGGS